MDDRTLDALRGSIVKWEHIVAGTKPDGGLSDCPLCQIFNPYPHRNDIYRGDLCRGCPVSDETGKQFCDGSPYEALETIEDEYGTGSDEYKEAARQELDFLKSLLPDAVAVTQDKRHD